jgi:hypothetical protein
VELKMNGALVNIRKKRLMLKSQSDKLGGEKQPKRSRSRSAEKKEERKPLKWVILPGLIVRVISKKVHQGRLYNKKLRVTDVLSTT